MKNNKRFQITIPEDLYKAGLYLCALYAKKSAQNRIFFSRSEIFLRLIRQKVVESGIKLGENQLKFDTKRLAEHLKLPESEVLELISTTKCEEIESEK